MLLSALLVLGGAAIFAPAGEIGSSSGEYQSAPLVQGFLQGYLTMDTLGALVFGIVIATAIRDRGISDSRLVTRYSMIAGVIAATGLSLVYLALFYLGATSQASPATPRMAYRSSPPMCSRPLAFPAACCWRWSSPWPA